jgi:hypothetical protein
VFERGGVREFLFPAIRMSIIIIIIIIINIIMTIPVHSPEKPRIRLMRGWWL